MSAQASEWSDLPNSSELFGGDFFGDELMDMYGGDADGDLGGAGSVPGPDPDMEARQHPGILVAMNAAAMDGGLSLGTSAEFVPMESHSGSGASSGAVAAADAVVKAATQTTVTVAIQGDQAPVSGRGSIAVPMSVTSASSGPPSSPKRAVPTGGPSAAQQPSKKLRSATAAAVATRAASTRSSKTAKIASSGGIKVGMQSSASAAAAGNKKPVTRSSRMGRVVASVAGAQSASAVPTRPATAVPHPARSAAATVPKSKMPVGGGINHSVLARPSSSYHHPSSASAGATKKPAVTASNVVAGVKRASSEADFKDVASAAVSSLIQSASTASAKTTSAASAGAATGSRTSSSSTKAPGGRAVDTSTAHISALTSQNWVAACNPIPTPAVTSSSNVSVSSGGENKEARTARRAALTQEERAKQNRDRNREHARNTRLRKKAYVEELKRTLTELVSQRDAADVERRHEAQRNREQREVRFRVMEEFLRLRGRNDPSSSRWCAILEDNFVLTLPRTPFRETVVESASDYNLAEQVLRGAAPAMEDSKCVSSFLETLAPAPAGSDAPSVTVTYRVDRKHFFMDGAVAFMDYAASSVGLVRRGVPKEVAFKGSMRASFSPASNKLLSVDLKFDTGSVVQQVDEISGGHGGEGEHEDGLGGADEADEILEALRVPNFDGADGGADAAQGGAQAAKSAAQANVSESDESVRSTDGSSHA